jgi:hypothetical protein
MARKGELKFEKLMTLKEIAVQIGVSKSYLEKKIVNLRPLFSKSGERKTFYSENEVKMILESIMP